MPARTTYAIVTLIAALVLGGAAGGCYVHSTMHRAEPVEAGTSELTLGMGLLGGFNGNATGTDTTDNVPAGILQTRFGLSENLGLGLRLNGLGLAADLNWAVVNRSRFALALDPEVSFALNKPSPFAKDGNMSTPFVSNHVKGLVNVLADVYKRPRFDLTVALKPGFMYAMGRNFMGATGPVIGAGVGARIDLVDDDFNGIDALITPSVDVMLPLNRRSLGNGALGYSAIVGFGVKL